MCFHIHSYNNHAGTEKNQSSQNCSVWRMKSTGRVFAVAMVVLLGRLHLEARHNYENLHTYAAWLGVNVSGGKSVEWELHTDARGECSAHGCTSPIGRSAAYTTLQYPSVFSRSLCQSGSFWWLADNEIPWPRASAKMFAERRISQIGATVNYNIHSGGHALRWLFTESGSEN